MSGPTIAPLAVGALTGVRKQAQEQLVKMPTLRVVEWRQHGLFDLLDEGFGLRE
jgi:hypothetical protein